MKDSHDHIIYVGKAKNLKRRVQTYFQNSKAHSQKIVKLKHNINDFDVILTDTEFEAFMLECRLIHELKPFFNRQMKTPQAYAFINIHMDDEYPRIVVTGSPDGLYFGPFKNKQIVEKAILGLKEFCKILCSGSTNSHSACLNYSLGLCIGICLGGSAAEKYRTIINRIIDLLQGKDLRILEEMKQKMLRASENFEFETAAKYRDYLDAIHSILYKENVIDFTEDNKNIAIIEFLTDQTFKLFLIKRNKILFRQKYKLEHLEDLIATIRTNMVHYYGTSDPHSSHEVSKEEIDEAQIIYSYLQSDNCNYMIVPENWLESEGTVLEDAILELFH